MYNIIIFTDVTDNIATMIPIGAYKVAHSLRKNGYSCIVVNHLSNWTKIELKELLNTLVGDGTFMVGFSTTFLRDVQIDRDPTKPTPPLPDITNDTVFPQGKEFEDEIINYIHTLNPSIKISAGGAKVNVNYTNKNVDYVFIGYSESSVVNLANHLTKKTTLLNSSKNIWGRIIIDDRLAKSYDFANEDMIWEDVDVVNYKTLSIEIGRGCIFKCKFCDYPLNGKKKLDFVKQIDIIKEELTRNYEQFGIKQYYIVDDTFNDHVEKLVDLRTAIQQLSFQPTFWGYHRLDLLCAHPETVQILYDIGVRAMYFGIETLYEETGKIIGKRHDRQRHIDMIRHIKTKYPNVTLHGSFILGLPGEPIDSFYKTFDTVFSGEMLLDSWRFQGFEVSNTKQLTFNSEFALNMEKYGITDCGTESTDRYINWKNEYTNVHDVRRISEEFMVQSRASGKLKISGEYALYLSGYNYKTFEELINTPFSEVDWNYLEYQLRPNFISNYKSTLLSLIKRKL